MATAQQVKALIKSHADGDDDRFYTVALQLAAKEARSGHADYARSLKDLVDAGKGRGAGVSPVAAPRGELSSLLTASYPKLRIADLAVSAETRKVLKRVIAEQTNRSKLQASGFEPVRRLLLVGPTGTGKSMTASVLAAELSLPLFSVRLDGLITKFMGETAAKLRLIFDAMVTTRGVYLFDEVDALAGTRESSNDVGEIRRVLNSFLQFLEQDQSESLLVATSNMPGMLDRAFLRRFDTTVPYELPTMALSKRVIRNRLAAIDLGDIDWKAVGSHTKGLNHAEVTDAAELAAKLAILDGSASVTTDELIEALQSRARLDPARR